MKSPLPSFSAGTFLACVGLVMNPLAQGEDAPSCGKIAEDVRTAVSKDPSKVLMIVEDALVISESCACEIVRAAISASAADAATIQQIVQTGIAVAPKYSAMITECASDSGPVAGVSDSTSDDSEKNPSEKNPSGKDVVASAKGGKSSNPIMPEVDAEGSRSSSGGPSLSNFSGNVRGVYLVYPAAGVITTSSTVEEDEECCDGGKQKPVKRANSRRTRSLIALSPSEAVAG